MYYYYQRTGPKIAEALTLIEIFPMLAAVTLVYITWQTEPPMFYGFLDYPSTVHFAALAWLVFTSILRLFAAWSLEHQQEVYEHHLRSRYAYSIYCCMCLWMVLFTNPRVDVSSLSVYCLIEY